MPSSSAGASVVGASPGPDCFSRPSSAGGCRGRRMMRNPERRRATACSFSCRPSGAATSGPVPRSAECTASARRAAGDDAASSVDAGPESAARSPTTAIVVGGGPGLPGSTDAAVLPRDPRPGSPASPGPGRRGGSRMGARTRPAPSTARGSGDIAPPPFGCGAPSSPTPSSAEGCAAAPGSKSRCRVTLKSGLSARAP